MGLEVCSFRPGIDWLWWTRSQAGDLGASQAQQRAVATTIGLDTFLAFLMTLVGSGRWFDGLSDQPHVLIRATEMGNIVGSLDGQVSG